MNYVLKEVRERQGSRYILLDHTETAFTISLLLFDILTSYQRTLDYEKTSLAVSNQYEKNIDADFIAQAVETTYAKLQNPSTSLQDGLYGKIPLIKKKSWQNVYSLLANLFNPTLFYCLIVLSVLSTVFFFYHQLPAASQLYQNMDKDTLWTNSILIYGLFTFIILFHEIGHSAAAQFFKVQPREIGFAFYFVFPVFYSNVTAIWQLPARQRNIVNLGGIYFQLIIQMLLIGVYYWVGSKIIVGSLIIANLGSMIGSLNPFFKYDGYWVFSDTFRLPNLNTRSRQTLQRLVVNHPLKTIKELAGQSRPLLVYSVLRAVFWLFVYVGMAHYIGVSSFQLMIEVQQVYSGVGPFNPKSLIIFFSLLLTLYLTINHLVNLYKLISHERTGLSTTKRSLA